MIQKMFSGLWRNSDFMKLWAGESISMIGNQISLVALPLTAVLFLNANATQMGLLGAIQFAPFLLFGLFAGAWVDRLRRKPLMILADIGRFLILATVPIAAFMDMLSIEQLYVVGFLVGVLTLFFDVAYQSYLPTLLKKEELTEGNSKLEATSSLSQVAGPSFGGVLVQAFTAPIALAVDAISFLGSAIFLAAIKTKEEKPVVKGDTKQNIWKEIGEGLRFVFGSKILRSIAACTATSNLFGRILFTVYVIYLTRELEVSPAMLGFIYAVGSIGSLVGALIADRVAKRFGLGKAIAGSIGIGNAALLIVPFTGTGTMFTIPLLILSYFIWSMSNPIYNINQVSMRMAYTPQHLLGRMNASMRTMIWGTVPIGYLIGGALGTSLGNYSALLVGAVGGVFAFVWLVFSPVFGLRDMSSLKQGTKEAAA